MGAVVVITADAPFVAPPRISREAFARVLRERAAPGVIAERDPGAYWDAITGYGLDPTFLLAMFNHESSMGKAGVAIITHSWGNTRAPSFGPLPIGETPGRTGLFPIFRDWLDGCKSTCARLVEPTWVYAGRTSIREIFDHPSGKVWAPAGDLNDPASYLGAVLAFMNRYADQELAVRAQIPGFIWKPADPTHFTMGRTQKIRGGAQHYTAGTNSLDWLTRTSGRSDPDSRVSATFLVKHNPTMEDRGWQLVRIEDTAWTTAFANPYTVSIEYEHQQGQPIPDIAYQVLAETWKDITNYVANHGLGSINTEGVRGHNEWVNNPQLTCPDGINVGRIEQRRRQLLNAPPTVDRWIIPDSPYGDHGFVFGFKALCEAMAKAKYPQDLNAAILSITGFPLGDEYPTATGAAQACERCILLYDRNAAPPFDVTLALRSAEIPARKDGE